MPNKLMSGEPDELTVGLQLLKENIDTLTTRHSERALQEVRQVLKNKHFDWISPESTERKIEDTVRIQSLSSTGYRIIIDHPEANLREHGGIVRITPEVRQFLIKKGMPPRYSDKYLLVPPDPYLKIALNEINQKMLKGGELV